MELPPDSNHGLGLFANATMKAFSCSWPYIDEEGFHYFAIIFIRVIEPFLFCILCDCVKEYEFYHDRNRSSLFSTWHDSALPDQRSKILMMYNV